MPLARSISLVSATSAFLLPLLSPGTAAAEPLPRAGSLSLAASTSVGVHNAYEKSKFGYFADALGSGAGLLELDVWTDDLTGEWRVNHDLIGRQNNCVGAAAPGELRRGNGNGDLADCFRDIRTWHDANPEHRPIQLKIEMKDGFYGKGGLGPAEFDALAGEILGDALFRPADLLAGAGGGHTTLDDAARTAAWPARDTLAGKVLIELIPGTFEQKNPFDDLWTDEEYGTHLRDLVAADDIGRATAFPAVLGAQAGDPRERYDEDLRPWFVVFDGSARSYVDGIDTAWYADNGYLLVMTSGHAVEPAIDASDPSEQEAADRVALLAEANATTITSDWSRLQGVLSMVLPRG
ncbi:phosphatidylinositol-specific phospholipase C domain-containing protein [Allosalinactinospora lopnorensis]|uniref:phosphatidylinositol-specific phospholipase C domain-containing protein n=1 Tax=Allosalinactinospora lopnorensis TaxID=1352348 RepID=UPI000623EA04|nr:phosphatidylinositol-specific phospholipase C domain-containing protein [Allosalinactinospora lopnorensis]